MRQYSFFDRLCLVADSALKTTRGIYDAKPRPNPAHDIDESKMSDQDKTHAASLMRINHTGEVCAQALYQGQALTAKLPNIRDKMEQAAQEEVDHLAWCSERIHELGSHESLLNPLWYASSFTIGALAGIAGDKWSLGFVAETEHQVCRHLDDHLQKLPIQDSKSRVILQQMREEELKHATVALEHGAAELPKPIKGVMSLMSKVMTSSVYYV
ncbi:2-polyprenyl-3-methyl-6-methoxy-1,4-benzoquinone monooxygenase [Kangiella koreensis]|uniref:3-demethoxyubiquinol 3-hydroxylase n=1 Tax=Kangiella koreensis (strain DSM 16069 / JCM 12317 / KCTC 12182 / SW-125) TaxID=523791 RepID=C7R7B3_KANKD|nr:2-polyprenyl-3-methyl-6-methoxy-1,4-benzoquinone monooxygenase [Kangiella koreensis]ACV25662.1 putative ubiquinone biosynthesis protein [Kangiella koreensis DSM 16069]